MLPVAGGKGVGVPKMLRSFCSAYCTANTDSNALAGARDLSFEKLAEDPQNS